MCWGCGRAVSQIVFGRWRISAWTFLAWNLQRSAILFGDLTSWDGKKLSGLIPQLFRTAALG